MTLEQTSIDSDSQRGKGKRPRRFWSISTAAAMLASGAERSNAVSPEQGYAPEVVKDNTVQQEVQALIRRIRTHLKDIGEGNTNVTKEEIHKLVTDLGDKNFKKRIRASESLTAIGYPAKPELKKALNARDPEKVARADAILKTFKPIDQRRANNLVGPVQRLGLIGKAAKDAVPVLIEVLAEDNTDLTCTVATALGNIGPEARAAVPALGDALKATNASIKWTVAETLGKLGQEAIAAVPSLSHALKDEDKDVRRTVAEAIGKIGPGANGAVRGLIYALKDVDNDVRRAVATTLQNIEPEPKEAVRGLISALKDEDKYVRRTLALVLGKMGPGAKEAVPDLIETLKDKEPEVRNAGAWALGNIGPAAKDAITALTVLAKTKVDEKETNRWEKEEVRRQANAALEAIMNSRRR